MACKNHKEKEIILNDNIYISDPYGNDINNISDPELHIKDEISLWRSVILQALIDCATLSTKEDDKMHKEKARNWISIENEDFITVCQLACLNSEYVYKKAQNIINGTIRMRNFFVEAKLKKMAEKKILKIDKKIAKKIVNF